MWFRMSSGIAAYDNSSALIEAQRREQRRGESLRLVRDNAPANRARLERREQRFDAIEELRRIGESFFVVRKKRIAHLNIAFVVGTQPQSCAEQSTRTRRCVRAERVDGDGGKPVIRPHAIQCAAEIACGIRERAVEIEQDHVCG